MTYIRIVLSCLTVVVAAAGCEDTNPSTIPSVMRLDTHPVSGSVAFAGKPAAGVRVTFRSEQELEGGRRIQSEVFTDSDGNYMVTTYEPNDGLPIGKYAVLLNWPVEPIDDAPELEVDRLRNRYSGPMPVFTITVQSGENKVPPFELK